MSGWTFQPTPAERRYLRSLEIQIETVEEKIRPHMHRLRQMKAARRTTKNRAYARGAYWKRKP